MKIAVNGDLFTLKKGIHELNLTVGGVPFKEDGLLNKVRLRLGGYSSHFFPVPAISYWKSVTQMCSYDLHETLFRHALKEVMAQ